MSRKERSPYLDCKVGRFAWVSGKDTPIVFGFTDTKEEAISLIKKAAKREGFDDWYVARVVGCNALPAEKALAKVDASNLAEWLVNEGLCNTKGAVSDATFWTAQENCIKPVAALIEKALKQLHEATRYIVSTQFGTVPKLGKLEKVVIPRRGKR